MTVGLFLKVILVLAMAGTVISLTLGLFNMFRKGQDAGARSNQMMRFRIFFQALAILVFSLLLFSKAKSTQRISRIWVGNRVASPMTVFLYVTKSESRRLTPPKLEKRRV